MAKYFLAFALSYVAALLMFAVIGVIYLFRWPVGNPPAFYALLWALLPLGAVCLLGRLFARRWSAAAGTVSIKWTLILLAVMAAATLLSLLVQSLQPLSAPGRVLVWLLCGMRLSPGETLSLLTLLGSLAYPLAFHFSWRLGA